MSYSKTKGRCIIMLNTLIKKVTTEENIKKDFKKLSNYVIHAKGTHRTINNFSADCHTNADYIADVINARINSYPTIPFLKLIADNSEGRVSLKDLTLACGYSNYDNNDIEQIKNITIRRGWFCYADLGQILDSEYGGHRMSLIIQNDVGNLKSSTTIIIPVTSRRTKSKMPTHVEVGSELQQDSIISCEQVRCVSKRRLLQNGIVQKIAEASPSLMRRVEVALMISEGTLSPYVNKEEVIEALFNLNKPKTYQYENNYSRSASPQVAFA